MPEVFMRAVNDTLAYVPRTLIVIFVSLFVSGVLVEAGVFKKLEFLGRPLVRCARLPPESALAFITSFGSVLAGNTMLAEFYRKKRIDRRKVFLSALLNGIPVYVKETFTYQIPVIIPILGFKVGGVYFLSFLAAGIVKAVFVVVYGRLSGSGAGTSFNGRQERPASAAGRVSTRSYRNLFFTVFRREIKVFLRVGIVFIFMTFIVFLLADSGALAGLAGIVRPVTGFFKLPVSAAVPVGTYCLSPLAGAASVGTMLADGALNDFQAVIVCMLGGFLMLPVLGLRYSLAKYTAIFGFSLGAGIVAASTLLGMIVRAVFLVVILFMI